jgi:hypothetical protein
MGKQSRNKNGAVECSKSTAPVIALPGFLFSIRDKSVAD